MHSQLKRISIGLATIACFVLLGYSVAEAQKPAKQKSTWGKAKVLRVYDPKTDETSTKIVGSWADLVDQVGAAITLSRSTPGHYRIGSNMGAGYRFQGKTFSRPATVDLRFGATGTGKYETKTNFVIKVDGQVLLEGKADYHKQQQGKDKGRDTIYDETLTLALSVDNFLRLANAKKVHITIGPDGFDLDGKQREKLRALAASLDKCEQPDCLWGTSGN